MSARITPRMVGDRMVVRVKGTDDKQAARKLAGQAAGTPFVGAAQPHDKGGFVVHVSAKALAARKVVGATPPAVTFAEPKAAPAKAAKAAKAAQAAPARELPAFLRKAPVTCPTCRDHGVVRKAGKHAGGAYKTADGAAAATANGNSVKCPTHKRARKAA